MYEIHTDIIKEDDDALLIDTEKHIGIQIGANYLEKKMGIPKYILIPVASGIEVYINATYKNKSVDVED